MQSQEEIASGSGAVPTLMRGDCTPPIAAGSIVVIRDEEWLVRSVATTRYDGQRLDVIGTSGLTRDQAATFFTALDEVTVLDPRHTRLVPDDSSHYLRSRLWLDSLLRQSPVPVSDTRIVAGNGGLFDDLPFQFRPAQLALTNLQPRILIADAVGLGKTLEIGIILSDLIKRGRGERILVVTPRAVLEQFQHEMWTRFAIPLVRLDSDGIQKVRRTLPASRNPFSYYRRVIISMDTLKNPIRYRHFLEQHRWDAVVIDECHNLINRGTQNNQLARVLARQSDSLILASATPHNGKAESFAELIDLLDPTAIADRSEYTADDIRSLYVRRHRHSDDVKHEVGDQWAERKEPKVIGVAATSAEAEVLAELRHTWLDATGSLRLANHRRLFPWTLFKSFLSSPMALRQSIDNRLRTLDDVVQDAAPDEAAVVAAERSALTTLATLNEQALAAGPAKLDALVEYLTKIGVGPRSDTRVVVFSERIATLAWLHEQLGRRLKLKAGQIRILNAQQPDTQIQQTVEDFGLAGSGLRVLLASDMASEGLNLHLQCHHLVHFDLPWSFIRIQQRNGRIDRYLQRHSPQITALALTTDVDDAHSDLRIVTGLLRKEHQANRALGDAGVLLRVHDERLEEEAVMKALSRRQDLDEIAPDVTASTATDLANDDFDIFAAVAGEHEGEPPAPVALPAQLFDDNDNYLAAALALLFPEPGKLDVVRDEDHDQVAFNTPPDLNAMFSDLPDSYLKDREVSSRIRLTADRGRAQQRLDEAKRTGDTLWPDVHYLAPNHPVLSWAASRVLALLGRNQAPVMTADVPGPIFLTQATWSNSRGQATIARWGAVTGPDAGDRQVADLISTITDLGLKEGSINPGGQPELTRYQRLVPAAVEAATADLRKHRAELEAPLLERIAAETARVRAWAERSRALAEDSPVQNRQRRIAEVRANRDRALAYLESLRVAGDPYVRVVAVIVPREG